MDGFDKSIGLPAVMALVDAIRENKEYLSEVDGAIGDGDHGINMNKGFAMFAERFAGQPLDFAQGLSELGMILMSEIGGSMGPLYGMFFTGMSEAVEDTDRIDGPAFLSMLKAGCEGIQSIGEAKLGDKTLLDSLIPAIHSLEDALKQGKSLEESLEDMKKAAIEGRDATKNMVAKVGRASRLGERSRGTLDAGATSCCIILCTLADEAVKLSQVS